MRRAFLLFLWITISPSAHAYFQMDLMKSKVGKRAESQWTLADWLTQKSRNRLADQWLAMHRSQDWFEFNMGGGESRYRLKTTDINGTTEDHHTSVAYHADIFLSLFNVFGEYEIANDRVESYGGGAGIRLLGTSAQTTNLIVRYGWRKRQYLERQEVWENEYAEALLQLYVFKFFGLNAKYRHYGAAESSEGYILDGSRSTAGAFLEWAIFRIYGEFYREPMTIDRGGVLSEERREGVEYGLTIYF